MPNRTLRSLAAALAVVALAGACNDDEEKADLPSILGTEVPEEGETRPPTAVGDLTEGTAGVEVTGDLEATLDLPLLPGSIYTPPPGGIALSYSDDSGNFLGMGGQTFEGSAETAPTLSLTITVVSPAPAFFVSTAGECTITIEEAGEEGVEGSFECSGLSNSDSTVDAEGTFSASA